MRAAVCREFGAPLGIEELTLAAPEEGEVRVRIAACAICHSDIAFAEGAWGGVLPAVYGHEAAGVVEEVGARVESVAVGDRVVVSLQRSCGRCYFCERDQWHLCELELPRDGEGRLRTAAGEPVHQAMNTGAFAEEVVVHESQVAPIPASLPFDVASLLGCGVLTGLGAVLDRAAVTRGSTVVVVGTGGVGLNVVQGAAVAGAEQILAVDLSSAKREAARTFGATHALDPASDDPVAGVRALTGGRGADTYSSRSAGPTSSVRPSRTCGAAARSSSSGCQPPVRRSTCRRSISCTTTSASSEASSAPPGSRTWCLASSISTGEGSSSSTSSSLPAIPFEQVNDAIAAAENGEALRNVLVFDA